MSYALDPDKEGAVVWSYRIGQGSGLGGQWGGAADEKNAYFGVSDILTPNPGGIRAVDLAIGQAGVERRPAAEAVRPSRAPAARRRARRSR